MKSCYWHQKCLTANAYPDEPILQEETKLIKQRLDNDTSATFVALDGWLPNFKTAYWFCETSWYILKDLWNLDENGVLFKALTRKRARPESKGFQR